MYNIFFCFSFCFLFALFVFLFCLEFPCYMYIYGHMESWRALHPIYLWLVIYISQAFYYNQFFLFFFSHFFSHINSLYFFFKRDVIFAYENFFFGQNLHMRSYSIMHVVKLLKKFDYP